MDENLTKSRILDTAAALFGEHGKAAVSTTRIAKEADVNKAMIFYYFGSKDELYFAAVRKLTEELFSLISERLSNVEPGLPVIETFVRSHVGYLIEHPALVKLLVRELLAGGIETQGGIGLPSNFEVDRFCRQSGRGPFRRVAQRSRVDPELTYPGKPAGRAVIPRDHQIADEDRGVRRRKPRRQRDNVGSHNGRSRRTHLVHPDYGGFGGVACGSKRVLYSGRGSTIVHSQPFANPRRRLKALSFRHEIYG